MRACDSATETRRHGGKKSLCNHGCTLMNTDKKCWGGPQVEGIAQDRILLICRDLSLSVFICLYPCSSVCIRGYILLFSAPQCLCGCFDCRWGGHPLEWCAQRSPESIAEGMADSLDKSE